MSNQYLVGLPLYIEYKRSAMRLRDGKLHLSNGRGNEPLVLAWPYALPQTLVIHWTGEFYVEMGRALERACFDYMIIEDKLMVSDAYGASMETNLKHGIAPKHDPVPLAVLVARARRRAAIAH